MKRLSVKDIDQSSALDELTTLIHRSSTTLQQLEIGLSPRTRDMGVLEVLGPSDNRPQLQRLEELGLDGMVVCPAFMKSLERSRLRSLIIVKCGDLDSLWASLSVRYSRSKNCIDILRLASITTDAVSAAFLHFIRETLHRDTLVDLTLYPSASSAAVYDFHVSVLKRHAESLQRLTVDVVNDDLRKIWGFTPKMISYLLRKMMRLTEVSIPLHPKGWDILHRDIRCAFNLRRLAITIDLGSKGPYQMTEEVKTAITESAAPLQVITIARKKFEILEMLVSDDDFSAVTSPISENSYDGKCLVLDEVYY